MFSKVLFTGFAAAALALAQMGGGGGGGMGGGGMGGDSGGGMGGSGGGMGGAGGGMGGGSMARAQKESKAELMADRLKLNKDQKLEFQTILESTLKDADPQIKQLLNSRNLLASAMISGKSDADIATLAKAMNDAQFQMIGVEVMAFRKVVGILKPNQVAKAPEAFDLMSDIFLPLPTAGRGGMGGMGGGGRGRGGR
jgi:hypothetical protein